MIEKLTDEERRFLALGDASESQARKALRIIDQLQAALDKQLELKQQALECLIKAMDRVEKEGK
jgi:hypothetical protein